MKYAGMPAGMWLLFAGSFRKHLSSVLSYDQETARIVSAKAKPKYREIIGKLPEFEKAHRFKMNMIPLMKYPIAAASAPLITFPWCLRNIWDKPLLLTERIRGRINTKPTAETTTEGACYDCNLLILSR